MVLDEIRLDDEDFQILVPELERSFGVSFERDLGHVHTAGDLFDEMLKERQPPDSGDRCDTAMTFFLLRRAFALRGLDARAWPSTLLEGQGLPPPRTIRALLAREFGLDLPRPAISGSGCAILAMLGVAVVALWMLKWALAIPVVVMGMVMAVRHDRGSWSGDWKTLGGLARATAIRNVASLTDRGARSRRADWWRAYTELLADYAFAENRSVARHEIGPATRFRFT